MATLKENAPEILTALGMAGVGVTAYQATKAAIASVDVVEVEKAVYRETGGTSFGPVPDDQMEVLTTLQTVKLCWPLYVPTIITGAGTMACIFFAYKGNTKRTVAAVTAYSLSERAFAEYREQVVQQMGENRDRKVLDAVAQEKVNANPPPSSGIVILGKDESLFCELHTMRYFKSNIDDIRKAVNDVNHWINMNRHVRLDDFYQLIGLQSTDTSDKLGWEEDELMALIFSTAMTEDERPCITFRYNYLRPLD